MMNTPAPAIPEIYAKNLAAFRRHTPFGALIDSDRIALVRCVARDARVSFEEAVAGILMRNISKE